jgi:TPR repeat protein
MGLEVNVEIAVELWRQAAAGGSTSAMYNLGLVYSQGSGVEHDEQNAAKWYLMAAQRGDLIATLSLADLLADNNISIEGLAPLPLYKYAANAGDPQSQLRLANIYEEGRLGAQPDREAAIFWYRKVVEKTAKGADQYREQARDALIRLGELEAVPDGGAETDSLPPSR